MSDDGVRLPFLPIIHVPIEPEHGAWAGFSPVLEVR